MSPEVILWLVLIFSWIVYLWEQYLSWRQYRKYVETVKRPEDLAEILDEESFEKSRLYKIDKARFSFVTDLWGQIKDTMVLLFFVIPYFWSLSRNFIRSFGYEHEILQSMGFIAITSVFSFFLGLPFSIYETFVIEEKHGFNKETFPFFLKDRVKKLVVSMALTLPIVGVVIKIIQAGGSYFFLYVWLFMSVIIFLLMTIYPEFIAPLFDKYVPLPDGELRTKIEELAAKLRFPLKQLYVVQGSKRSAHSNAYLYGLWNNKRIVLYDTLLEESERTALFPEEKSEEEKQEKTESEKEKEKDEKKSKQLGMKNDEVVAVLGHELGHWQLSHNLRNLLIGEIDLFMSLAVFALLYHNKTLYVAFGFPSEQPTLIGLLIIFQYIFAPYQEVLNFCMTYLTRMMEFQADKFSADLGYATLLCSALIKVGKDNLSFPVDDWLYSFWHHSHPPLRERVAVLKKYQ